MPMRTDEELLLAAGRGDREAFGQLVERHYRAIISFAHRFLSTADRAAAEDLAQRVFLGAWRYAPTFRPRAKATTWLFRIARNACLDHRRYERLRSAVPADRRKASRQGERVGPAADALAETTEQAQQLRAAVAGLPPNQRAAIVLRHFHGFSYAEIAEILETSVSAVDALLYRARHALIQKLGGEKN